MLSGWFEREAGQRQVEWLASRFALRQSQMVAVGARRAVVGGEHGQASGGQHRRPVLQLSNAVVEGG